ncbi:MAG: ROK family protein [Pleurocapsa minor GSE-CHR-MK-17-07R]|jgi:glucokinase|nr:ROK family protein [Pleurocapsa minor GSE-CHR-MK 17-07R]
MTFYIGIDLGGTKIASAVWDADRQQLVTSATVPTSAHEGPDAVLARIAGVCRDLASQAGLPMEHIAAVGLGVPATFDADLGVIYVIPNLPGDWYGKPAAPILSEALGCPVHLVNDARAFTLAEATIGAGKGTQSCVGLTLGTGIGGGIAINGRLYLGLGAAGEFGHITLDPNGPPDGTGNPGGWEGMASGPAISAMGMRVVAQGITTKIGEMVNFDLNKITPEIIARAADEGDEAAINILNTVGFYLGTGLSTIVTILAPECVVVGGGVARLGERLMRPIRETLKLRVHTVDLDKVRIMPAALGSDAGVIGAAVWASQRAGESN